MTRAHQSGRLKASVTRDAAGRFLGVNDPFLADMEWERNSDMTMAPPDTQDKAAALSERNAAALSAAGIAPPEVDGEEGSAKRASTELAHWRGQLARLKFEEARGELVAAAGMRRTVANALAEVRTRLMAVPRRAKQAMPDLSATQVACLEDLVREALTALVADAAEIAAKAAADE